MVLKFEGVNVNSRIINKSKKQFDDYKSSNQNDNKLVNKIRELENRSEQYLRESLNNSEYINERSSRNESQKLRW